MSENTKEPTVAATNETTETAPANDNASCKGGGSCCKPHTSLTVSVIALLLSAFAAFTAVSNSDTTAVNNRLNSLDSQISALNDQLSNLNHEMEVNRENLIQTKLKKALQSIQEIGSMAGDETRATITEVEKMLKTLTSVGDQLNAAEQAEVADTPAAQVESAPAEIPAASTDQSVPAEEMPASPAGQSTPATDTTPDKATAPAADSTIDNSTPTTAADSGNANDKPSAPQAF